MGDIISFYIKGRKEGYFDVRLESVLNEDKATREVFLKGYQLGKAVRKGEELNETEEDKLLFLKKRTAYITSIGYKAASEGYPVDVLGLKGADKEAFDIGYSAGALTATLERDGMIELNTYQKQMRLVRND